MATYEANANYYFTKAVIGFFDALYCDILHFKAKCLYSKILLCRELNDSMANVFSLAHSGDTAAQLEGFGMSKSLFRNQQ